MANYSRPVVADRGRSVKKPWYVSFSYTHPISGTTIRERVYNGKKFGIPGEGNRLKTVSERRIYFARLCDAVAASLEAGTYFADTLPQPSIKVAYSANDAVLRVLEEKQKQISFRAHAMLKSVALRFSKVLPDSLLDVTPDLVSAWLSSVSLSNAGWNNNRRELHLLFAEMVARGWIESNPVAQVKKRSVKAVANEAYTPEQLTVIFNCARAYNQNLYLCLRLMFHAFVRPHIEARLLQRKHVNFDTGFLLVPASLRKSGDVFSVPINADLLQCLEPFEALPPDAYLIHAGDPFLPVNRDYFTTLWARFKEALPEGTIRARQTMYSMRHSAACIFYRNTKDVEELRRAMGHTDLGTTLIYLRSLGLYTSKVNVNDLPTL